MIQRHFGDQKIPLQRYLLDELKHVRLAKPVIAQKRTTCPGFPALLQVAAHDVNLHVPPYRRRFQIRRRNDAKSHCLKRQCRMKLALCADFIRHNFYLTDFSHSREGERGEARLSAHGRYARAAALSRLRLNTRRFLRGSPPD